MILKYNETSIPVNLEVSAPEGFRAEKLFSNPKLDAQGGCEFTITVRIKEVPVNPPSVGK